MRLGALLLCVPALAGTACRKAKRADQRDKNLATLGYLSSAPVSDNEAALEGVTRLEPDRVSPGITIACLMRSGDCLMVDMSGKVVHQFKTEAPADVVTAGIRATADGPFVLRDYDESSFILLNGAFVQRVDWSGKVLWSVSGGDDVRFHHDLAVRDDKSIVVIGATEQWVDHKGAKIPVFGDGLYLVHPDGKVERLVSMYDALKDKVSPAALDNIKALQDAGKLERTGPSTKNAKFVSTDGPTDLFHLNTVDIAPADGARWKKGDYILYMRELGKAGMLAVLDPKTFAVRWTFEGDVDHPHDPEILPNGNLSLFDNGKVREWSRVIEIDPTKETIVREYKSSKPLFLSHEAGGAQPLPNGNMLITEAERGHLFEITPAGETVWEYWAPVKKLESDGSSRLFRDLIFRARRVTATTPSSVVELQKLVTSAGPLTAIRKATSEHPGGRAWPVGANNNPRMSFAFAETATDITYRATSGPIAAGEYRVTISNSRCSPEVVIADLGTVTSTGASAEWSFDGKLVGKIPDGGLANLADRYYVAVTPKGGTDALACGKLFLQ